MKKTALVIAMTAASASAMAAETVSVVDAVEVRDVYVGAEIGGNFLLGEEEAQGDGTFKASNMLKVGAELGTQVTNGVEAFVATEARFAMEGIDGDFTDGKYDGDTTDLYKFTVGVDTVAGRTEFGILEGVADVYDDFGDLSLEHGLSASYDQAKNGESTLQHIFATEKFEAAASYDFETEHYVIGGSIEAMKGLKLGASYMGGGDEAAVDSAYNLGAVYSMEKIDLAAKFTSNEVKDEDYSSYALGAAYHVSPAIKVAATFNDTESAEHGEDEFFTVGASYQFNKNVQFVTDYKVGSESDDQLFVRANLNF